MDKNKSSAESYSSFDGSILNFTKKIKRQQKRIYFVSLVCIIAMFLFFRYQTRKQSKDLEAEEMLYNAVTAFEASDYRLAIEGNDNFWGFGHLVKTFPKFKNINLIKYYLGISYLNTGRYADAIEVLSKTKLNNKCFESLRLGLIAECFVELKNYENAALFYSKAANNYDFADLSPDFFEKAAISYEKVLNYNMAEKCFATISSKYPEYKKDFVAKNWSRLIVLNDKE